MLFLLLACTTPDEDDGCASWPDAPTAPDGSVEESCGWWALAVGDHLYANVFVSDEDVECDAALDAGLALNADPIYSAQDDGTIRWTYDVVAEAAGQELLVDVSCDDETRWQAKIDVE